MESSAAAHCGNERYESLSRARRWSWSQRQASASSASSAWMNFPRELAWRVISGIERQVCPCRRASWRVSSRASASGGVRLLRLSDFGGASALTRRSTVRWTARHHLKKRLNACCRRTVLILAPLDGYVSGSTLASRPNLMAAGRCRGNCAQHSMTINLIFREFNTTGQSATE